MDGPSEVLAKRSGSEVIDRLFLASRASLGRSSTPSCLVLGSAYRPDSLFRLLRAHVRSNAYVNEASNF